MGNVTDKEVLTTLLNGGVNLCNHAIEQWESGKYDCGRPAAEAYEAQRDAVQKYQAMKVRMRELVREMKSEL